MKLYAFFRSGTSHRVRIALRLKGVEVEQVPIDLRADRHCADDFLAINPQGLVPALQREDGRVMTQSPAIIEWLEEVHPDPPLLPEAPDDRARVRALAALVACDIHPINNRRVLEALRHDFHADEAAVKAWCTNWIVSGFDAFEALLASDTSRGRFCFGDAPTLADVALVPQVESARRFAVDVTRWRRIASIDAACAELEAFRLAAPGVQPDAR